MSYNWGVLSSFAQPIEIATDAWSMLWMFPLLLAIAIVYKATKMRILSGGRFVKEVAILFGTISGFMVFLGVTLTILVKVITE